MVNILVPPYIDAKSMHDVTAICGDRVKFDLPIFGEPVPEVTWTRTGSGPEAETVVVESTPDRNIVITSNETHTKLVINSVTKGLSGKYTVRVSNASGNDEAKADVKVLDRPEAPQALQANVEGTKCNLLWKKSKDDGGSPIEHYQVLIVFLNFKKFGLFTIYRKDIGAKLSLMYFVCSYNNRLNDMTPKKDNGQLVARVPQQTTHLVQEVFYLGESINFEYPP